MKPLRFTLTLAAGLALGAGLFTLSGCGRSDEGPAPTTQAGDDYPLTICVVSGHALGSMGDPYVVEHEGQQVKLCCAACEDEFRSEPAKYLAMIAAARAGEQVQVEGDGGHGHGHDHDHAH